MKVKDYMSSADRDMFVCFIHMLNNSETMATKSQVYTKEEITNLKKSITWGTKALTSVLRRLNPSAKKTMHNMIRDTKAFLDYGSMTQIYAKRKIAQIDAAYEENREYYKLVELIMAQCCMDCKKNHNECFFYKEFEEQFIPNFDGSKQCGPCRYSFEKFIGEKSDENNIERNN